MIKRLSDGNLEIECIFCGNIFICSGICTVPLGSLIYMRDRSKLDNSFCYCISCAKKTKRKYGHGSYYDLLIKHKCPRISWKQRID